MTRTQYNVAHQPLHIFDASKYRIGIVVAQFNSGITKQLLDSAEGVATQFKIPAKNITVRHVAGSVEIPVILQAMAKTKRYDALLALGAIIRGETAHFDYVAKMASEGVLRVMLDHGIPIGFGILACFSQEQAQQRVHGGGEALAAALHCAKIIRENEK